MATINYFIQSKNDMAGIYIRLREGRKIDAKAKTKYVINPKNWSATKGQPKNLNDESLKNLNEKLSKLSADLLKHYNSTTNKHKINTQWLKNFVNPPVEAQKAPNKLIEYFDYYAKHIKSSIGPSTFKRIEDNKRFFEKFQKATKSEYYISDIDADFKLKFESYCRKENYAINTTGRALKYIKTICYHARYNGVETSFQLDSIKAKFEKVDKIFLTPEELDLIQKTEFEFEYLINARDWLIISCETGQRVSDFMRFKKEQIRIQDGVPLIEFTQVKTGKIMSIPLSKTVRAILKKRDSDFPRPVNELTYNIYIKEVCKLAGITEMTKGSKMNKETRRKESGIYPKHELVTSHIGRRTFATNNYGKIPTSLLINVTGHSTEVMFLEYIGKTVTEKAIQLAGYIK